MSVLSVKEALDAFRNQEHRFLVLAPDVPEERALALVQAAGKRRPVVVAMGETGLAALRKLDRRRWPLREARTIKRLEMGADGSELAVAESAVMAWTTTKTDKKSLLDFRGELVSGGAGNSWYWALGDLDQQLTEAGLQQFGELLKAAAAQVKK